jgi:hypothetical protein
MSAEIVISARDIPSSLIGTPVAAFEETILPAQLKDLALLYRQCNEFLWISYVKSAM